MLQTFARHGLAGMVASLLAMPVMAEPLSDDAANQLLQRISDMEREVSTLRGDNEKLRNEVENLQKDQKDRFTQVDEKMDKLKDTAKPTDINSSMSSSSTTSSSSNADNAKPDEKKADSSSTSDSAKSDSKPVEKTDPNSYYSYGTGKNDDANPPKTTTEGSTDKPAETKPDNTSSSNSSSTTSSTSSSVTSTSNTAANGSGSQDERSAYDVAFETLLKAPKDSIPMFRKFLKDYPNSSRASVAQYYIGAAYYTEKDYKAAVDEFLTVLREYKGSEKGSDAALKLGYSFYELQDWDKARKTLEDVIKFFPNTDASRDASTRLDRMKSEGH